MPTKEEIYEEAGITGTLGFGDAPAVLVVDLQTAFTDPACPLGTDLDDTVESTATLLDVAREADVPVFFSRSVFRADGRDGAVFAEKVPNARKLTPDSGWIEIDPRLSRTDEEVVVEKQNPSAFFETGLDTLLTYEGVDTLVVAGASTSGCVRATVVDACQHGYRPIVPVECVGDRAEVPHRANLFDMGRKYADLMDRPEVERRLREVADGD